jgi:hypothetical protein
VRAEANQIKVLVVGLAVNQDEVGPDMAVAVIGPFTKKWVINVDAGQGLISGEQIHDFDQGDVNDIAVPP